MKNLAAIACVMVPIVFIAKALDLGIRSDGSTHDALVILLYIAFVGAMVWVFDRLRLT